MYPLQFGLAALLAAGIVGGGLSAQVSALEGEADGAPCRTLCRFGGLPGGLEWRPLLDGVMGGVSTGVIERDDQHRATFHGTISLENNGGFAAVIAPLPADRLHDGDGVALRVRGDGRTYRLALSTREGFAGPMYEAEVPTTDGVWTETRVPLAMFASTWRGEPIDPEPLAGSQVRAVGVFCADGTAGPFRLELGRLSAWPGLAERLDLREVADLATEGGIELFRPLHDTVMGGLSTGELTAEDGSASFHGVVSLERNGGFASIRSRSDGWDLGGYDGLLVEARGDGRQYRLCLTQGASGEWPLYWRPFEPSGEWAESRVAFADLEATVFGQRVAAPAFDASDVGTVGLMVADKQAGAFRLDVRAVSAYRVTPLPAAEEPRTP